MNHKKYLTNILIGLLFTLLLISLGVFLAIHFRPLYYFDIDFLNIEAESGFSREIILKNYNALIDYCSPFFYGPLTFPTFLASPGGIRHFAEVKVIFNTIFYLGLLSIFFLIPLVVVKARKKETGFLLASSLMSIFLPLVVGLGCAINFDAAFVIFHKIFFRNDDWIFDWYTDEVIRILPETYFLHCALLIIGTVLLGSLFLYLCHRKFHKKNMDCKSGPSQED